MRFCPPNGERQTASDEDEKNSDGCGPFRQSSTEVRIEGAKTQGCPKPEQQEASCESHCSQSDENSPHGK